MILSMMIASNNNVSSRKISLLAGFFYLLTFVSIPTLAIYAPLKSTNYILSQTSDISASIGAISEITVILKKHNETAALGLVAARILESSTIFVGVAFILSIITLHQARVGVDGLVISRILTILYDRIFLLGQSFMPAVCDLLLGFLLFRSRLVPRGLSLLGLIGGPVLLIGYFAVLFGLIGQHSPLAGLSALPVALFEFTFGVWLIIKGFNE